MMNFKVTYQYLDDQDCSYSVVFGSEYELLGGLSVFLSSDRIGTDQEVHIISIDTIYSSSHD